MDLLCVQVLSTDVLIVTNFFFFFLINIRISPKMILSKKYHVQIISEKQKSTIKYGCKKVRSILC